MHVQPQGDVRSPVCSTSAYGACREYAAHVAHQAALEVYLAIKRAGHRALQCTLERTDIATVHHEITAIRSDTTKAVNVIGDRAKKMLLGSGATDGNGALNMEAAFDAAWRAVNCVSQQTVPLPSVVATSQSYRLGKAANAMSGPLGAMLKVFSRSEAQLSEVIRMLASLVGKQRLNSVTVLRHASFVSKASGSIAAVLPYASLLLDIYIHFYDHRLNARRQRAFSQYRRALRESMHTHAVAASQAAYLATKRTADAYCEGRLDDTTKSSASRSHYRDI